MKKASLWILLTSVLLCSACISHKTKPAYDNGPIYSLPIQAAGLEEAFEQAYKEGKYVLLNVGASWCMPCKKMAKEVLSLSEVQDFIHNNYIYYYCDAEKGKGPLIAERYQVSSVPTLILLDGKGNEIKRNQGALGRSDFMKFIYVEQ